LKDDLFLNPDAFNQLLFWLDPDRERAGIKYEEIRLKLIKIFSRRGCTIPEDLTDDVIDRVMAKVEKLILSYVGDPTLYFLGVAQKVYLEYLKKKPAVEWKESSNHGEEVAPDDLGIYRERVFECLDHCLKGLDETSYKLIIGYYQGEKRAKIDYRVELAKQLGLALNALRTRAHRIKTDVHKCLSKCLQ
jgi:DNA-directed RNA polymerase specialized sigma24 family protein